MQNILTSMQIVPNDQSKVDVFTTASYHRGMRMLPLKCLLAHVVWTQDAMQERENPGWCLCMQVIERGVLRPFSGYAGRPGGSAAAMNVWEYSMLMRRTKFVPAPAGVSAEQFRIWEAFEAGAPLRVPPL